MIRRIGSVLLILCLFGGAVAAPGAAQEGPDGHEVAEEVTEEVEEDDEAWDSVMFRHSFDIQLYDVQFEDGYAIVYMEADSDGEEVIITDSSRETSGEMERYRYDLEEGENVFRIPVHNPRNGAVTVDAGGSIWLEVDDDQLNLLPAVAYPIIGVLGGVLLTLALILGLDLLARRKSTTANNPIR